MGQPTPQGSFVRALRVFFLVRLSATEFKSQIVSDCSLLTNWNSANYQKTRWVPQRDLCLRPPDFKPFILKSLVCFKY